MSDVTITIQAIDAATAQIKHVAASLDKLGDQVTRTGSGFRAMEEVAVGALRHIGASVLSLAVGTMKGLADQIGQSIAMAGSFDAALNRFASVAGTALTDAGLSFDAVKQKALAMGQTTQFSASEALAAMTELVKGGVAVDAVMGDATEATLALAAAAQLDLADAATIVAKQLGVWGATGVTAAQAADLLAAAANASTVDVEELALGLANVGGTARTAGLSFNETIQTMALIAPLFSSAADAGTSFKTFISRLIPTTKDAMTQMIELGLATEDGKSKFFDASGSFVGMEETARMLHEALAGLSEEEKLLALNTIFGADAIRAASAIAEAGAAGFTEMGAAMAATGGAAAAAAQQQQGYEYALSQVRAAMETLQITVGTAMLPALTAMATTTAGTISQITSFVAAILSAPDPVRALADAVGIGSSTIGTLQETAQHAADVISSAWAWMATHIVPATVTAWQAIWNTITGVGSALMELVSVITQTIMAVWAEHGETILITTAELWTSLMQAVGAGATAIQAIVTLFVDIVTAIWREWGDELLAILAFAWQMIAGVIDTGFDVIAGVFRAIAALLRGDWVTAWQEAQGVVARVWQGIQQAVERGKEGIMNVITALWPSIKSSWDGMISSAASLGSSLISGITSGVTNAARDLARSVADAARNALDAAQAALGISSPSKLAMREVGMPLGEGVLIGMSRTLTAMPSLLRESVLAASSAPSPASVSVSVGGITINAAQGMDERRLAILVREEVNSIVHTARVGRI